MTLLILTNLLVIVGIAAMTWSRINRIGLEPCCANCRFDLSGIPDVQVCPECGSQVVSSDSVVVGRPNQRAFRIGMLLILLALPFVLLLITKNVRVADQHKPFWLLRTEYRLVHQNEWRFYREAGRRLDSASVSTSSKEHIASVVLRMTDELYADQGVRETVKSALRNTPVNERSKHIHPIVQHWVDDLPPTHQDNSYSNLYNYIAYSANESDIEPIVKLLESQRAALRPGTGAHEIYDSFNQPAANILHRWFGLNQDTASATLRERIRGEPFGIYIVSPTVFTFGEPVLFKVEPWFAGLMYELPGLAHLRVTEIRVNGEAMALDPIEITLRLDGALAVQHAILDLYEWGEGEFDLEFDVEVFASDSITVNEYEWGDAVQETIHREIRIVHDESQRDSYWASAGVRNSLQDSIKVGPIGIETGTWHTESIEVWAVNFEIIDSPVQLFHNVIAEQAGKSWNLGTCYAVTGGAEQFETNKNFLAQSWYHSGQLVRNEGNEPQLEQPMTIRLIPRDQPTDLRDSVWPYEIELGPFIPQK